MGRILPRCLPQGDIKRMNTSRLTKKKARCTMFLGAGEPRIYILHELHYHP